MASVDFTDEIRDFKSAAKGEDVRDSLVSLAEAVEDALNSSDVTLVANEVDSLSSESANLINPLGIGAAYSSDTTFIPKRTGVKVSNTVSKTYRYAAVELQLEPDTTYTFIAKKETTTGAGVVAYVESTDGGTTWPSAVKSLMSSSSADNTQVLKTFTTDSGLVRIRFYCTYSSAALGEVEFYDVALYKGSFTASTLPEYVRGLYAQDDFARNETARLDNKGMVVRSTLTSADDVHNLDKPGTYYFAGSNKPANLPSYFDSVSSGGFRIVVVKNVDTHSGEWHMLLTSDAQTIWVERCTNATQGTWSGWVRFVDGDQMFPMSLITATQVADNTDFNTLTTPGSYYILSATSAATMLNIPEETSGRLNVMLCTGDTRFYQTYYTNSISLNIYVRAYTANGFSAWKKVAYV